ncbi:MAG: 4Fe-4S dicluster domain-containing protein [Candidatus Bathyarchaeia archaeon]
MVVQKRRFGRTELYVSTISLGGFQLSLINEEEAENVVTTALRARAHESNVKAVARFKPLEESERHFLEELGKKISRVFCRPGCGKCLPCPQGIEIDKVILAYQHSVYMEAEELGYKRYERLKVKPEKCDKCGVCQKKCPNGLPIPYLLEVAQRHFNIMGKRNI